MFSAEAYVLLEIDLLVCVISDTIYLILDVYSTREHFGVFLPLCFFYLFF